MMPAKHRIYVSTDPRTGKRTIRIQKKALQKQHPDVSAFDRGLIMNFATEQAGARYLEQRGFKVRDLGGYNYEIKKQGEDEWRVVDPEGFDWQDVTDLGGDFADIGLGILGAGFASGASAVPTAGLGSVAAGAAGFGGGVAVSTGVRSLIGSALGIPAETGEVVGESLKQGAVGAVADLTLGAGGLAVKSGLKSLAAKRAARTAAKEAATRPKPMPDEWAAEKIEVQRQAHGDDAVRVHKETLKSLDEKISETVVDLDGLKKMVQQDETLVQKLYRDLSPEAKTIVDTDRLPSGVKLPRDSVGEVFDAAVKLLGKDEAVRVFMVKNLSPSAMAKHGKSLAGEAKRRANPVLKSGKLREQFPATRKGAPTYSGTMRRPYFYAQVKPKKGGVLGREADLPASVEKGAFPRRPELYPESAEVNPFAAARGGTGRLDKAGKPIPITEHERALLKLGGEEGDEFKTITANALVDVIDYHGKPISRRLRAGKTPLDPRVQSLSKNLNDLIDRRARLRRAKPSPVKNLTRKELEYEWNVGHEIPRLAAIRAQKEARTERLTGLLSPLSRGVASAARVTGKAIKATGEALQTPARIATSVLMRTRLGKAIGDQAVAERLVHLLGASATTAIAGGPAAMAIGGAHLTGAALKGIGRIIMRDPASWALRVLRRGGKVNAKTRQLAQIVLELSRTKGRNAASTALYMGLSDATTRKMIEDDSKRLGIKQ